MVSARNEKPQLSLGIKSFAENHVKFVDGQGEFAKNVRGVFVMRAAFQPAPEALKTLAQGERFIDIAESPQQTFHVLRLLQRGADDFSSVADFDFAGSDALEQETLEFAAIPGAFRINIALTPAECRARLAEFLSSRLRFLNKGQPKRPQAGGMIFRAQLHVGENHPIAAQAAFPA